MSRVLASRVQATQQPSCSYAPAQSYVRLPRGCKARSTFVSLPRFAQQRTLLQCRSQPEQQAQPPTDEENVPWEKPAKAPVPESTTMYDAVTALASVGLLETAYLTYVKVFHAPLVCPTSGCESVLTSSYSELFGIPLSFFGMAAYGLVGLLSVTCAQQARAGLPADVRQAANTGLTGGVALLTTCSAFLVALLQTQFGGTPCAWCYLSAGLSFGMALTLAFGMPRRALADAAMPGMGVTLATLVLLYGGLFVANPGVVEADEDFQLEYKAPIIKNDSSDKAIRLARQLRDAGAKMYGAFWCSHCYDQKETFGSAAMKDFPYVECYPDGWKRGQPIEPVCDAAGVRAFPTWVINGRIIEGELSLEEVEAELAKAPALAAAK